jgi:hypothetical protein
VSPRTTQGLKLRLQEEISRIPADMLHRAMSSVHDRLAESEQRNGGHLEDVIFRVEWCVVFFFYVQWYISRPLIHLFLQMLKYVLPYECNCIVISSTFNFLLTLKNRPIQWQTLYIFQWINRPVSRDARRLVGLIPTAPHYILHCNTCFLFLFA